jgi:hypothetical protein
MSVGAAARGIPGPYALPGAAGLIPFVVGALAAWFGPPADYSLVLYALATYAAVILSFVGALHWGVAMMDPAATGRAQWAATLWSVTPALIGWAALLLPTLVGLRVMAGAFLLQLAMDRALARRHPVPPWFLPLRYRLSIVAALALFVATLA